MINTSREKMLRQVQAYDFALYDTVLYLNAYPSSRGALNAYNKYSRLAKRARDEYEAKYGPLTLPREASTWNWTDGPWPWQEMRGDK